MKFFILAILLFIQNSWALSENSSHKFNFDQGILGIVDNATATITIHDLLISCDPYGNIIIKSDSIPKCHELTTKKFYCGNFGRLLNAVIIKGNHELIFSKKDSDQKWTMEYSNDLGTKIIWINLNCT